MEARAPGRRWPVKTASRRSRARAARALTGLRRVRDVLAGRGGGAPDQDGKIKAPSGRAYVVGRSERVYLVIREIRARPVVAPLPRAIRTASGDVLDAPLLLIDVLTDVGVTGRAYAFAYTPLTLRSLAQFVPRHRS
jgi:hypothetical protein